jgi:hypothetical protein
MSLGLYRVTVLCRAGLPFPHPTEDDYAYIKEAFKSGVQPEYAAKVLRRNAREAARATVQRVEHQ